MKKKSTVILSTIMILSLLSGCAQGSVSGPESSAATQESSAVTPESDAVTPESDAAEPETDALPEEKEKDYTTGTPWLCSMIDGTVTEDTPTDPKDDFYLYVNKDKLLSFELTDERPEIGPFVDVIYKVDGDIRAMYEEDYPESHDARLVYDLYHMALDWETRDALGVEPLKKITDEIEAISSIDELTAYFTKPVDGEPRTKLWRSFSTIDPVHSDTNILMVNYCPLLRRDSAEYSAPTPRGEEMTACSTDLTEYLLVRLGYSEEEARQKIENCMKLEGMLAPVIPTQEERMDPDFSASQNKYVTREELEKIEGNIPILEELEKVQGFPAQEQYMLPQPAFFEKLNEVYTEENLPLIRDYLIVHNTDAEAPQLDHETCDRYRHMYDSVNGPTEETDEQYAAGVASAQLHWAVARLYAEKYLKQEDKDRISAVVEEIIEAYHDVLNDTDWISEETRKSALEKLDSIDRRVLFPDSWDDYDYEGLDFKSAEDGGNFYEAYAQIQKYLQEQDVKNFDKPVNNKQWSAKPQEVNCGYQPLENAIYILGAFAQGDLYNSEMSDEELYGKLGVVIAHEISHAVDIRGSQYDKDGNQVDWWTPEDKKEFRDRNDKMIAYFESIHPWEGQDINGLFQAGEACADITGMKCVLGIAAQKQDFDYDAFFRAYADLWCSKMTPDIAEFYVEEDEHPMKYLRINVVVQQFDEFLETYGIKEGDKMYLAPEDRVHIW